jgi:CheY-like chemotaxis protein
MECAKKFFHTARKFVHFNPLGRSWHVFPSIMPDQKCCGHNAVSMIIFVVKMKLQSDQSKILVVEDSDDDFFFFSRALTKAGILCDCARVSTGTAATAYLQENQDKPILVFLDLKIPLLNGFEVLEWLQSQSFKDLTEIVVLSGSDDARDVARAQEFRVSEYLVKPIAVQALTQIISKWLTKTMPVNDERIGARCS